MVQKDAFKILQSIVKKEGVKLTLEQIRIIMKALEETCLVIGEELDEGEVCRIVNFLEIRKKTIKGRRYKVLKGEHEGEERISDTNEYTLVKNTESFMKKTKKKKGKK